MSIDLKDYEKTTLSDLPLTAFWGDLDKRWSQVFTLLGPILNRYQKPKVLDLAMGAGLDTLKLLKMGYEVVSNEIDFVGIDEAMGNAKSQNLEIDLRKVDWNDFTNSTQYPDEEFDIAFSLGNSFPNYLFNKEEREQSLRGFWKVLKPGGTLIFDARNFDHMLNDKDEILKDPEHNFIYNYQSTYLGKSVKGFPVNISGDRIHMVWKNYEKKTYAEMELWPATVSHIKDLIRTVIGNIEIEIYFDYTKYTQNEMPTHYDMAQFVIKKPNK